MTTEKTTCLMCQQVYSTNEGTYVKELPETFKLYLKAKYGDVAEDYFICEADLIQERIAYVRATIGLDQSEMSLLHQQVLESIAKDEMIVQEPNKAVDNQRTLGQRVADRLAKFGGSWIFIFAFIAVLLTWIIINSIAIFVKPFDPYPFILLNLVLSCLAAIQAPVIMMSQNRQEARDREQSTNDYKVNLKSEIEIRLLHEKMDHMMTTQWQRLLEVQSIQVDLLETLCKQVETFSNENQDCQKMQRESSLKESL
ncbi:DUF1003 domain-containing protein [Isobaculum melis]|uniref:Uncharacterized membrane protein n=1 Tax=Isobaculum melis TaxID=142588 RepID=A0A1H9QEG6_9LACT|nr:DUF1003 domain-containing protein [Isobaculum melis]SER58854.1 Uncharacterized membrane protein [Isobaculum melis]